MNIKGWKYYNHAVVPTCAPHETPDLAPISDERIWSLGGGKNVLFARFVTDFDCNEETPFWYVVKDGPFVFEALDKKYQKNVKRALDRCEARRINQREYVEDIWRVYSAAYEKYETADNEVSKEEFVAALQEDTDEYWGAFNRETGEMAGWMSCQNYGSCTETKKAKYHPDLQSYCRPSDVLHYAVLNHYLNELHQWYVTSGTRNINHKTNVQEYKIKNWNFRKAYCILHEEYRPGVRLAVGVRYPLRQVLMRFDGITKIHQLNALLMLEKLARECRRKKIPKPNTN